MSKKKVCLEKKSMEEPHGIPMIFLKMRKEDEIYFQNWNVVGFRV